MDITVGTSLAPRIPRAVDAKSPVLFGLVLVVCGLFLAQAALASVRSCRTGIGTLRCVGWSAPELLRLSLGELAMTGIAAGTLGALLAYGPGALSIGAPTVGRPRRRGVQDPLRVRTDSAQE